MIFGKHINKYYLRYAPLLILGLVSLVLVDYIQLEIPTIYRDVINGMNSGYVMVDGVPMDFNMGFLLSKVCKPMMFIVVFMVVGRFTWRICFIGTSRLVETRLRSEMFNHAKDLSQEYYQVNKVGNLMSLFTNDLETIQECIGWGLLMLFDALFLGILAIIKMYRMHGFLTLFTMIPLVFLLISSTIVGKRMEAKWEKRQEAYSKLSDFAQESFSGIAVIKAFVKESLELINFKKVNKENEETNISFTKTSTLFNIMITLFIQSINCIIFGYGGYLVFKGMFNAGELIEFLSYFSTVIWPIMALSELVGMTSRGKASLSRISELLDAKITVKDRDGVKELAEPLGEIEFRNLNFKYPGSERQILSDMSFSIKKGENVGLVGKTGAGKTTIVDLILRTYQVPDGTIFMDGQDVNSLTIKSVRNACAYVPQDNFLFSDTILNNIAFSEGIVSALNEKASDEVFERVKKAAVLSDIDENIMDFTGGYETVLGERGVTVSGGQKQRISIARALLKDAPILILDDSVSAVDTKTEKKILENLRETRLGKTTILIAHRISTIQSMDKIIFIDDGKLLGVGTHEELYASNSEYRTMVDLQKLEEEAKN
ncbi:MAG: ABC transporter ATP-binding protein/permease [Lachnospiraceae bacterium]|nr:ABC transporter ATP-binding protein/permease [Lachnospiraceae bacterium]